MDTKDGTLRYVYFFLILGLSNSYDFRCPEQSEWSMKANTTCSNVLEYFCLLDYNRNMYKEFCNRTPDLTRLITWKKGHKCVIRGSLDGEKCTAGRYQPFKFRTDGNSDCVYKKNLCKGEGMIIYKNGSTTSDTLCRCDHAKGFAFVSKTKQSCYCKPSEEDCSCYKKECEKFFKITPDYNCTSIYSQEEVSICPEIDMRPLINSETQMHEVNQDITDVFQSDNMNTFKIIMMGGSKKAVSIVLPLTVICIIIVIVVFIKHRKIIDIFKGYDSKEHEEKENINKDKTPAVAKNPDVFDVHTASWKTDDKTYTVTRSTIKIENKLREQNCVLVVGCSGNGKSATIRHIALKLCKNEGYDIIPNVVNPTTISQNYNQNKKQLFVIDNFCGEVVTNAQIVALWSSQIDDILKLTKNNQEQKDRQPGKGNLKLLFATIPGIFKDTITICKRIGCLSEYKLDLSEIPLQDEEKLEMIKKYFPEQMSNDLTKTLIRHEDIFPLLCKLSKGKTADQIEQLFLNHKLVIKNDFMAQKNKNQKCLMVLCVLFESLHEDDFSVEKNTPEKDKSVIETVCSEFDVNLKKKTSRLKLQNELKHLDEKYFFKLGDSYQLVHKDVYDIAAIYCGDTIRNSFISFAPSSVIAERCSFISKNSSEREPYIFIDDDTNKNYFDRLMTDLGKGITYSMFHNSQLLKESYIEAFCSYCRKRREKLVELLNRLQQRSFKPFNHLSDKEKASSEGNVNVYDDYLEFTKSYHFASHDMKIPLIESAWEGITDIVDLLLDMERKVNVTDRFGRSALYVACYHGKASVAKRLLERGAEHSLCDNDETSPLHAACIGGQKDVVQLLIEKKADINKCNKKGVSPLMAACSAGRISVVSVLVKSKVNINKIDNNDKSALFKACKKGHHEIVEILLQNGANVMQCDWANLSPLYIASAKGRTKTVSVLLDYKVDISYSDEQGRSPLFMACENGYEDIVDILLEKSQRVDLRTADKRNRSPLYVACGKGFIKIVKKLVTKGAKINQCDNSHSTPLLKASIEGHFDIVEYLISHTADLNAFDSNGRTPLLAACDEGHIEIVRVLVEKGSNINHRDNDNRNALEITQNRGYSDIEDILKNWLTE